MRKVSAVVAALLLCTSVVFAQKMKKKAEFGFKAGVNISSFRTAVDYSDFGPDVKLGQVFGGFVQIPVTSRFFIQPEFLYSQLGSKAGSTIWGEVTFRYNYFSMPVLLKYNLVKSLNVYVGGEFDFLIRARTVELYKTSTVTNDVNDFDFGYTAGLGTSGKKWTFDARYIHGSRDVSPVPETNTFFNQAVQLTVGYKLHKRAKAKKAKGDKKK